MHSSFTAFHLLLTRTKRQIKHYLQRSRRRSSRTRGYFRCTLEVLEDRTAPSVTPLGTEFQVNTYTQGPQQTFTTNNPPGPGAQGQNVAINPTTGDFVVTWSSQNQDGNGWGVYGQRYRANGTPQGGEFQVNTTTNSDQEAPSVAMDGQGSFIITWTSHQNGHWDIYAQRYNADGVAQGGEFLVNTTTTDDQTNPTIAVDAAGDFVIAWSGHQNGHWNIYAQRYNASGVAQGGELLVDTPTSNDQESPSIAMDAAGDFVVTWQANNGGGSGWDIYAQRYNASGAAQGGEFLVNTTTTKDQQLPSIGMDAEGDFVIAWQSNQAGGNWSIFAQRYSAAGVPQGSEFQVSATSNTDQQFPGVAMSPDGSFVVTWSNQEPGPNKWDVFAQAYDATGTAQGGNFLVNTTTNDNQQYSAAAMAGNQHFVIVWSSNNQDGNNWGVFGQQYSESGVTVTPTSGLVTTEAGGQAQLSVVLDSAPTENVTISVSSSDTSAGTVSTSSLVFTPATWNQAQTVTLTGQDDQIDTPNRSYQILFGAAQSSDPSYNNQFATSVTVTNQNTDVAGVTVTPLTPLTTSESGGTAQFSVVLKSKPTSDVIIPISSSDTSAGTVSTSSLVFTAATWSQAQTVTVTGQDDDVVTPNTSYQVQIGAAQSSDTYYNSQFASTLTLTNQETDVASITVSPTSGLMTSKSGGTATFSVVLTSKPTAPVTVSVSSSNPQEGTVSTSSLTFTASSWNIPQLVTVMGQNDGLSGDVSYQVILGSAVSTDPNYAGYLPPAVAIVNKQVAAPCVTVTPTSGLTTSESGGTAQFTVVLDSAPSGDVTIPISSSNTSVGIVSASSLVFTPTSWNQPQTVTVTGQDDEIVTPNVSYQVLVGAAQSSDASYNNQFATSVNLTNQETDVAGVTVTPLTPLTTSESGGTAQLSVVLSSQPTGDVTIPVSSSNPAAGIPSVSSLVFTAASWSQAQTVTITGQDDQVVTPDTNYSILFGAAQSSDSYYNNQFATSVSLTNQETDVAGVTVTPLTPLTTSESGGTAQLSVVLTSQPTGDVTIPVSSSNPAAGIPSVSSLVFTAANWSQAQTVTITGQDDQVVTPDTSYQVLFGAAQSSDSYYNNQFATSVSLTNQETDVAGITVTPLTPLTTSESGGTAQLSVVLSSQPTASVTITLTSSNTTSGGTLSASMLTFDAGDWNVPQTVLVVGVDDHVVTGDTAYQVTTSAASADPYYQGLLGPVISLVNRETDTAGILVTPTSSLTTTSAGGTTTFQVVLTSQPTATVTLNLSSSNPSVGAVSNPSLIFDATSWNSPQTVTVAGVPDPSLTGDVSYSIQFAPAQSLDPDYNGLTVAPLAVTEVAILPPASQGAGSPSTPGTPTDTVNIPPSAPVAAATVTPAASGATPTPEPSPEGTISNSVASLAVLLAADQGSAHNTAGTSAVSVTDAASSASLPGNGLLLVSVRASSTASAAVSASSSVGGGSVSSSPAETQEAQAAREQTLRASRPDPTPAAPVPPAAAAQAQSAPSSVPLTVPLTQPAAPATPPGHGRRLETAALWKELDAAEQPRARSRTQKVADAVFIGGVVASAGYLFLSSRAGALLLSALTARPLWRQLDPLDVLFAWEQEKERRRARGLEAPQEEEEESLQDLVS